MTSIAGHMLLMKSFVQVIPWMEHISMFDYTCTYVMCIYRSENISSTCVHQWSWRAEPTVGLLGAPFRLPVERLHLSDPRRSEARRSLALQRGRGRHQAWHFPRALLRCYPLSPLLMLRELLIDNDWYWYWYIGILVDTHEQWWPVSGWYWWFSRCWQGNEVCLLWFIYS